MSKEMFIASSPHETKVAVLEDDQLVEVYYQRDTDVGLVGGIYKGRVSRVLPGMQSAFVDIGLERDAFLYVSDFFFEDQEEYEKVFDEAEARATRLTTDQSQAATSPGASPSKEKTPEPAGTPIPGPEAAAPTTPLTARQRPATQPAAETLPPVPSPPPAAPSSPGPEARPYRRFDPRGRRRRGGRGRFGEQRYAERKFLPRQETSAPREFEILPGESLAKYSHPTSEPAKGPEPPSQHSAEVPLPDTLPTETAGSHPTEDYRADSALLIDQSAPESGPGQVPPESPTVDTPSTLGEPPLASDIEAPAQLEPPRAAEPSQVWAPAEPVPPVESHAEPEPPVALPVAPAGFEVSPPLVETVAAPSSQSPEEAPPAAAASVLPEPAERTVPEPAAPLGTDAAVPMTPGASHTLVGESQRTYTMREPYQRPRFAPRRGRRGRRGTAGQRPSRPGPWQEPSRPGNQQPLQIAELLKEGQEILVQIAKEPLGTKGARITSHIALPGRYLVYMPTVDHIGVSRKIASEEERLRLRNIVLEHKGSLTGGFIVRTAGQGRSDEELKADLAFLSNLWSDIRAKADRAKAPALIHRDLDLVQRLLRDTLTPDFKSVRVDNETEYAQVLDFVDRCQPSLVGKIKLYTRDAPLFEEFGVQAEIEKALKPKVWLKSGGYIVINQTEALVAIDVNTGKYVGKTNRLEDTILKTNIDAVNEIVRQIRLRDLGGIIVIDFIDMDERKNRARVVQALEEALRHDRAPTKVISFHDFGLVAITRKRVKQSLERTLCEPCGSCSGSGWVKSVTTVCYEILAEARKMARQLEGDVITVRVSPEVAKALKSREGVLISELEALTHKDVIVRSDPSVHQERFEIF